MKKPIKYALVIIGSLVGVALISLVALVIYAKFFHNKQVDIARYYVDELNISENDYTEVFEEIYQTTLDNYSLYQSKGLNMDSLHNSIVKRIESGNMNNVEFGKLLKEFFSSLNVGHAFVYLRDYTADYSPEFIENRIFISKPNAYLVDNGFKDKDEIISINGLPVSEWISDNEKYTSASTRAARRLNTALKAFRSWSDTIAIYGIARNSDTITVELPLKKYDLLPKDTQMEESLVECRLLNDSTGYINIKSMMNPVTDDFEKAYQTVASLPNLVIDIRRNEGGNSRNGKDIAEFLITKPQPHCVSPETIMQPRENAYNGKLFLLIDTYTFSAAESFALDLKESGNVTLVGSSSAGDTGNNPQTFSTEIGNIYFRFPTRKPSKSPKGFPMEGEGIAPHYEVVQSVADFMNDRDTALDYTLGLIEK